MSSQVHHIPPGGPQEPPVAPAPQFENYYPFFNKFKLYFSDLKMCLILASVGGAINAA